MRYKTCYTCKETKPIAMFTWDEARKDKHSRMCQVCGKKYQKKTYKEKKKRGWQGWKIKN